MNIGLLGITAAIAFSAIGSALGTGFAGMAAIGSWKRCLVQNKPAPFLLITFVGAPLTQTIYGLILMGALQQALVGGIDLAIIFGAGIFGGAAIGASALFQGKAAAAASDAFAETKKGFPLYLFVLGLIETVALFVMVFLLNVVSSG